MKKSVVFFSAALLLTIVVISIMAFRDNGSGTVKISRKSLIGTWHLESYKYGTSSGSFTQIAPDKPRVKLITEKRFLWATYDTLTKKILKSAGGEYSLEAENYIESIDLGFNMNSYLNTKGVYKIKIEDGMLYLTGTLSDGLPIEEIWQKTTPVKNSKTKITGTWSMESYKYGSSPSSFALVPSFRPHLQLITEDQFIWATYDTSSKKILESAGGNYSFDGTHFVVDVDYGFNMDGYLGISSNYNLQLEKDMYFLSGNLTDGYKIEEIWQRIK